MSEWISADECTPWGNELVLAGVKYADDSVCITFAWHGDEQWSGGWHILEQRKNSLRHYLWNGETEFADHAVITHWMPLPELPEEEE